MPESARIQVLLDERSAALARRRVDAGPTLEATPHLVCTSGSEYFGLSLAQVASVMPGTSCTPLPAAPPSLRGIVALSGVIVTVIDLAAALGLGRSETSVEQGHLIRLKGHQAPVALAVDRVLGIVPIMPDSLTEAVATANRARDLGGTAVSSYAPPSSGRAVGIDGSFAIIDLPRLLNRFLS